MITISTRWAQIFQVFSKLLGMIHTQKTLLTAVKDSLILILLILSINKNIRCFNDGAVNFEMVLGTDNIVVVFFNPIGAFFNYLDNILAFWTTYSNHSIIRPGRLST